MKTLFDPEQIFKSVVLYGGNAVTECLIKSGADTLSFAHLIKCEFFIRILSAPNYQQTPLGIIKMKYVSIAKKLNLTSEPLKIGMSKKPETPKCKDGYDHSNVLVWTPEEGWYVVEAEHIPKRGIYDCPNRGSWKAGRTFKPKGKKIKRSQKIGL